MSMHDALRALRLLLGTAWHTDRWRSLGALLDAASGLSAPLSAVALGVLTDALIARDEARVTFATVGWASTIAATFLIGWVGARLRIGISERVGHAIDVEVATAMSQLHGVEHLERTDYQDRVTLLAGDQQTMGQSFNSLANVVSSVVRTIVCAIGLVTVDFALLAVVAIAVPAALLSARGQKFDRTAEELSAPHIRRANYLDALVASASGGRELRVFDLTDAIAQRRDAAFAEVTRQRIFAAKRSALLTIANHALLTAGVLGATGYVMARSLQGRASAGAVITALALTAAAQSQISATTQQTMGLGTRLRSLGRVVWLNDYRTHHQREFDGHLAPPQQLSRGITLDHVSFQYPGSSRWALRDVSFSIPPSSVVALVGDNGAGKTTLIKLLLRLYDPTEGQILIDGNDLRSIDIEAWRASMTGVFQDFVRPELLLREAVGLGRIEAMDDDGALHTALTEADSSTLLNRLYEGLDSQLGRVWSGAELSTGEWQRVALARGYLRRRPVLQLFDEPTASLDALSEDRLFRSLTHRSRIPGGPATVLVSHRFSTVRIADLIVVFDSGTVVELGAHAELRRRSGYYSRMFDLQATGYVEGV